MNRKLIAPLLFILCFGVQQALAVTGVNPTGVNVRSSGSTSAFLTFQNLDQDESSQQSFFCGDLIAPAAGRIKCLISTPATLPLFLDGCQAAWTARKLAAPAGGVT